MSFPRITGLPLSIVVADPGGGERLLACLKALRDARLAVACEVIAVVGGTDRGLVPALRQQFPLVPLYQAWGDRDLGSLYGQGCRVATGKYVLLLDGSARVDGATIQELMAFMEQGPWVAMVAPRLLTPDGRETSSGRLFPSLGSALAELDGSSEAIARRQAGPRLQNALDRRVTTPKEVDAVSNGCCLVKRAAIAQVGALATGYPAGGELLDWCRRARLGGWSVFYHAGQSAHLIRDELDDPRSAGVRLAAACRFIRFHRGLLELLALEALMALPLLAGLVLGGGAALIPGTHRAGARSRFWRSWYLTGALVAPRRFRAATG